MKFEIQKNNGSLTCWSKTSIDKKKCFVKIILGTKEENILKEFIGSINVITTREREYPHIFTFNRRDYMSFILSRIIKYYENDLILDGTPLDKWRIEDLRDKFGNFNDEYILFNYFGLEPIENRYFYADEMQNNKNEIASFFKQASTKIYNLSVIASRLLRNTYSFNTGPKVVISLEVQPLLEKKDEFLKTFPYLKDEPEETIIRYMRNNFAFSKLLGIAICKLTDKPVEEEAQECLC